MNVYDVNPPRNLDAFPMIVIGVGAGFHHGTRYVSLIMQDERDSNADPFVVCFSKEETQKVLDYFGRAIAHIDNVDPHYYERN